jgi:hypothetical protein
MDFRINMNVATEGPKRSLDALLFNRPSFSPYINADTDVGTSRTQDLGTEQSARLTTMISSLVDAVNVDFANESG